MTIRQEGSSATDAWNGKLCKKLGFSLVFAHDTLAIGQADR
jgi:hypothetical protein